MSTAKSSFFVRYWNSRTWLALIEDNIRPNPVIKSPGSKSGMSACCVMF